MKIVFLDAQTLNPGDLSWHHFKQLGELEVYPRTTADEFMSRAKNAEVLFTNKIALHKNMLSELPRLRYIGITATGYNMVDIAAAKELGITVTNVPAYSTPSVAQAVFALLLELTNHTGLHNHSVHQGNWTRCPDFCYWERQLTELDGLTMGIIGWGNIGKAVAHIASAFGMKILVHTRTIPQKSPRGVKFCDLEKLLRESDVVSLHCPLTEQTKELINADRLNLMKPSAFLINTGRGALINEADLANALDKEKIAGAALDVLSQEPPQENNLLLHTKNCIITPHIAWVSQACRQRLMDVAFQNLKNFLDGHPQNVIN